VTLHRMEAMMDRLWDVSEVSEYLRMSKSWVYRETASGRLPCLRLNGWSVRFDPQQVRAYAARSGSSMTPVVAAGAKQAT
jgi:excisionase family DNA binding protein